MLKRFWRAVTHHLKTDAAFIVVGAGVFFWLYVWRLGSLTVGLSPHEVQAAAASSNLHKIISNPIDGPHKLTQLGMRHILGNSSFSLRLASILFAALALIAFYCLAARWFGRLIGFIASLILSATPLLILSARQASPAILYLTPVILLSLYNSMIHHKNWLNPGWLLFCLATGLSLYVPGLLWLLLAGLVIGRRGFSTALQRLRPLYLWSGLGLFMIVLSPLIYGLVKSPEPIRQLILLPALWPSPGTIAKNFFWSLSALLIRTQRHFELLVGRTPILSIIETALLVFGGYAMTTLARKKFAVMVGVVIFAWLAASINTNLEYLLLALPAICIIAAAGLRYLFLEWLSVFPRNPIPKYFAYGLMMCLALVQINYAATYSLSAWPHTPETKKLYVLK